MNSGGGVVGGAAPTGCYKCGRPGHWSRDCPSNSNSNDDHNPSLPPNSDFNSKTGSRPLKQKAQRKTRPKLTPDLLLSDAGIGHILRYFPRALKCRGRGHEVNDLRHLLRLYAEWHSRLLPYYNFDQFIHKVEQVGATKRVKVCLKDLQERVANGLDPSKVHEPEVQQAILDELDTPGGLDMSDHFHENNLHNEALKDFQDDMPLGMWEEDIKRMNFKCQHVLQDTCTEPVRVADIATDTSNFKNALDLSFEGNAGISNKKQMSEEQRARMEANRVKALERASARKQTG